MVNAKVTITTIKRPTKAKFKQQNTLKNNKNREIIQRDQHTHMLFDENILIFSCIY